ncbi:DNA-binding LytR/AlgR family response regulator [Clostridium tetanomorphum]|uniref:Stage 0 sporulation protein A homolog n=1 Tax=Clostridium tetanomorphum TaxID=1553 RepID=A0A923ECA5_CLOTT|nr:LytTR family DNA-binding domain-containing protein [Clostridium tetanomorphum]MBC2399262.1 response regulator transcription factor [Clostridium tetanomorphum]MBP1862809.1 DNA-binding LytR/AlgR family response regulator [Clostridium tetanomorphum]NRS86947.1 DNA-binding LytR/AlgR family response regulator [Clostridium tetanomorphum]NRZ99269.1 DNA-binding LytR/AlgR family response regulator [Clostridium tetanomorphum]SQC00251.1 DNA-binding response regulator [Clostridium tetanomorphum]
MLKIAVCDDEILQGIDVVKKIKSILENNYCNYDYDIEEFSSGEQMISSGNYFDIVFLDIKMGKLSGIDIAKSIRENNNDTKIVFITAFKEYVFEAFDVSAFHYLIKPVSKEKISEIIDRIFKVISHKENSQQCIVINKGKSSIKVLLDSIHFFEVQNRIINIHTERQVIQYYDKLTNIESKVPKDIFFRCHRSYIVNLKYVMKFNKTDIILDDGTRIMLSKSKYDEFSRAFLKYIKRGEV